MSRKKKLDVYERAYRLVSRKKKLDVYERAYVRDFLVELESKARAKAASRTRYVIDEDRFVIFMRDAERLVLENLDIVRDTFPYYEAESLAHNYLDKRTGTADFWIPPTRHSESSKGFYYVEAAIVRQGKFMLWKRVERPQAKEAT